MARKLPRKPGPPPPPTFTPGDVVRVRGGRPMAVESAHGDAYYLCVWLNPAGTHLHRETFHACDLERLTLPDYPP